MALNAPTRAAHARSSAPTLPSPAVLRTTVRIYCTVSKPLAVFILSSPHPTVQFRILLSPATRPLSTPSIALFSFTAPCISQHPPSVGYPPSSHRSLRLLVAKQKSWGILPSFTTPRRAPTATAWPASPITYSIPLPPWPALDSDFPTVKLFVASLHSRTHRLAAVQSEPCLASQPTLPFAPLHSLARSHLGYR